ncbi:AI-2E family transporter, partial [Peptostreptococcaceae bacterium OttesenSCG-928-C18]|nr:AI-2E family transporter [Peptostreptococcaceae bacterium OttesenSCG-928-C18]
ASSFFTNENYEKLEVFFKNLKIDSTIIEFLTTKIEDIVSYITNFMKGMLPFLANIATGVITTTVNWFIGFVVSIYLLLDKERFVAMIRKVMYSFFPTKFSENIERIAQKINTTMKGYISGQFIVVSVLGLIIAVSLSILGVEGAIAMGFIIAVTDLIPIVGPWIGSAPVFLMIAVQDFKKALIFIVIILVAQQIEENLVRPKVQGQKLGISSFWVLVSIIIGGSLFGIVGMIVGTPIFVVLYQLIKEISEYRLNKKGLPVSTSEYSKSIGKIDKDRILDINDEK